MRRRRSKISVNVIVNGERGREGGRLVVTNKPEEEGRVERGKNTEAPPLRSFDPFLPSFPYFSTVPPKPLFGRRSFPCFRTKAKPHCSNQCTQTDTESSEVPAVRHATVLSPASASGGVIFTLTGSRSSRGVVSSFWTTLHSVRLSRLPFFPIAICPYFCPDHQKGYRSFGELTP